MRRFNFTFQIPRVNNKIDLTNSSIPANVLYRNIAYEIYNAETGRIAPFKQIDQVAAFI